MVPEPQAPTSCFKTGEVHVAEPPFDDVPAIKDSGDLEIIVAENTGQMSFGNLQSTDRHSTISVLDWQ